MWIIVLNSKLLITISLFTKFYRPDNKNKSSEGLTFQTGGGLGGIGGLGYKSSSVGGLGGFLSPPGYGVPPPSNVTTQSSGAAKTDSKVEPRKNPLEPNPYDQDQEIPSVLFNRVSFVSALHRYGCAGFKTFIRLFTLLTFIRTAGPEILMMKWIEGASRLE